MAHDLKVWSYVLITFVLHIFYKYGNATVKYLNPIVGRQYIMLYLNSLKPFMKRQNTLKTQYTKAMLDQHWTIVCVDV